MFILIQKDSNLSNADRFCLFNTTQGHWASVQLIVFYVETLNVKITYKNFTAIILNSFGCINLMNYEMYLNIVQKYNKSGVNRFCLKITKNIFYLFIIYMHFYRHEKCSQ